MSEHTLPLFGNKYAAEVYSGRQSLVEFTLQVRGHLHAIRTSQDTLRTLSRLFSSQQRVWPTTCNNAIKSLTSMDEQGRSFHAFIERSLYLPLVVVPLRLPLLLTLKNVDAQITKLNQLLAVLRDMGKTALSQPAEQRLVIGRELDVLMVYSEEVLDHAQQLLDRAKEEIYSVV